MKTLIYTVAYDNKDSRVYQGLAKLLASSIIRSGFTGEMVVFHNGEEPLFKSRREGLFEMGVDLPEDPGTITEDTVLTVPEQRWALKHRVSSILLEEFSWDRLLFIDADCLVVGPLGPVFEGDFELAVYREPRQPMTRLSFNCFLTEEEMSGLNVEGINSGIFCMDRSVAPDFFSSWEEASARKEQRTRACTDQAALNRVVLDKGYRLKEFGNLVSMPYHTDMGRCAESGKSIIHWIGLTGYGKLQASFGKYMEKYLFDPSLTLFNLMET